LRSGPVLASRRDVALVSGWLRNLSAADGRAASTGAGRAESGHHPVQP